MDTTMDQTDRVLELVRDALADNLLGVYLHGSVVFGGLHPTSDLDVFAVVGRAIRPASLAPSS